MKQSNYVNGNWCAAEADVFDSTDPSNGKILWSGRSSSGDDTRAAFAAASAAFEPWSRLSLEQRMEPITRFQEIVKNRQSEIAALIASETGKQLWDASGEAAALVSKVDISLTAYHDRTGVSTRETAFGQATLQHRPHGVMAVLGPYNFPAHLPNGQILPALIAGNTIVFKPSELTPAVGELLVECYAQADFPAGVINLVQGSRQTGEAILSDANLAGVLFTGSAQTGAAIHRQFAGRPEIVLALEMGGNNPLVVWNIRDAGAAASLIGQSAFISSGQRCTCARRLIIPDGAAGEAIIDATLRFMDRMTIGSWDAPPATIGPLISGEIASRVIRAADGLVAAGGTAIRPPIGTDQGSAFVSPGLIDVTGVEVEDKEIFGPVLTVIRIRDWDAAIAEANNTRFGLAAGLVSEDVGKWEDFRMRIRAGVVNFNRPTTGAAGFLPFGGPGASGNHNPGAYYAADFCAWPMASQVSDAVEPLPMKGLKS